MKEVFLSRLREFIENEVRSSSMDFGCITPLYVYRMWGGAISMEDIENGLIELWRENEPKETFPQPRLDRWSTSVATRDSRSKLHSLLAAPSVPLYGKDAIDYEGNPLRQSFGMILETFLRPDGSKRPEVERGTSEQVRAHKAFALKGES